MLLDLKHKNLPVYRRSIELDKESYRLSMLLPVEEKYNLIQQIRRAALSVLLNIAEGSAKKSARERCRYYETARGSVVEIDTGLTAAVESSYLKEDQLKLITEYLNNSFGMLSAIIKALQKQSKN